MAKDYEEARDKGYLLAVSWNSEFGRERFRELRNGLIDGLTEFTVIFDGPFQNPKVVWDNTKPQKDRAA